MTESLTPRHLIDRFQECAVRKDWQAFAAVFADVAAIVKASRHAEPLAASEVLVRRYFAMWSTGEWTEADAVLGRTYLDHSLPSVVGPAAVRSFVRRARKPDADLDVVAFDAEYVVARRAVRAVRGGSLPEPDARWSVALFRVADGQLAEQWSWSPTAPSYASGHPKSAKHA